MVIRFHLDEHVHPGIAVGLRSRGIDTTTPADVDLAGADDEKHLAYALSEQRVVVTHDSDFLRLHAVGSAHAGIAYCHQDKYPIGFILQMLLLLPACESSEEMQGRVEYH
jgi:hypothetical protein